jgi:hypothetical protein
MEDIMKSICVYFFIILFLLTACGSNKLNYDTDVEKHNTTNQTEDNPNNLTEDSSIYNGDSRVGESGLLPVYIIDFNKAGNGEKNREYLNKFLHDQGFNLEFKFLDNDNQIQFIRDNINENAVFIPSSIYELQADQEFFYQLGDFHDAGTRIAPNYTRNIKVFYANEPGKLRVMPIQFNKIFPEFPAVLIREGVAAEYGKEVRTASEYIELLQWLKAKEPSSVPGVTVPTVSGVSGHLMAFDFFMPEWGYWTNMGGWAWNVLDIRTNDTYSTYSVPESRKALEDFVNLWRDGFLYMKNNNNTRSRKLNEFPTALLYFYDFLDTNANFIQMSGFNDFDANGYRIYALYSGVMPSVERDGNYWTWAGTEAIAGSNTEINEFLRFMEWLWDRDNYLLLFFGVQGEDYTLTGGRMVPIETRTKDMADIRTNIFIFEHTDLNPLPLTAPWNYEDELHFLEPAHTLNMSTKDFQAVFDIYETFGEETMRVNDSYMDFSDLMNELFNSETAPSEEQVQRNIDRYIEKQQSHSGILDLLATTYGECFKTAAERDK